MKKLILTAVMILSAFSTSFAQICTNNYMDIRDIVTGMGWKVTSERGGGHNAHSKHYVGKAVDVSVRGKTQFDVDILTMILTEQGYEVRDERIRPKGQKVWNGAHMHIAVPYCD